MNARKSIMMFIGVFGIFCLQFSGCSKGDSSSSAEAEALKTKLAAKETALACWQGLVGKSCPTGLTADQCNAGKNADYETCKSANTAAN